MHFARLSSIYAFDDYRKQIKWQFEKMCHENKNSSEITFQALSKLTLKGAWKKESEGILKIDCGPDGARSAGGLEKLGTDFYFDLQLLCFEKAKDIYDKLIQRKYSADNSSKITESERCFTSALERTYKKSGRWALYLDHSKREGNHILILDGQRIPVQPDNQDRQIQFEDYKAFWRDLLQVMREVVYTNVAKGNETTHPPKHQMDRILKELHRNLKESLIFSPCHGEKYVDILFDLSIIKEIKKWDELNDYFKPVVSSKSENVQEPIKMWIEWLSPIGDRRNIYSHQDQCIANILDQKGITPIAVFLLNELDQAKTADQAQIIGRLLVDTIHCRDQTGLPYDFDKMSNDKLDSLSKYFIEASLDDLSNFKHEADEIIIFISQLKSIREIGSQAEKNLTELAEIKIVENPSNQSTSSKKRRLRL